MIAVSDYGYAAGCEARLCLAGSAFMDYGLRPSFGLCPMAEGHTEGTALILSITDGKAEPCLTSGGIAVIQTVITPC